MLATITFNFDPSLTLAGASLRWESLALAGTILLCLLVAALAAGLANERLDAESDEPLLRRDDLILIAFGVVPGAVVGGRLGYGLVHLDYYLANPLAIFDPGQGGMALTLGVAGGILSGLAVGRLLATPLHRWLALLATPSLLGLGLGKLVLALGASGQGAYFDSPISTTYAGVGPWESANPSLPALPSQLIEGGLVLVALALFLALPWLLRLRVRLWHGLPRPGWSEARAWPELEGRRRFATMLGFWGVARFIAAFTWRDAHVAGPFVAEQLVLAGLIVVAFEGNRLAGAGRVAGSWAGGRARGLAHRVGERLPAWAGRRRSMLGE